MNIRKATMQDLEDVLRLNKGLFDYETTFNTEYNLDWTYSDIGQRYFKKEIEDGDVLVAEVDGHVVGYSAISIYTLSFSKENPVAELDNMFIEEQYRRQGIGKQLVKAVINLAKDKGAKRLKVEAAAQNEKAIQFYHACGFADFDVILNMKL